MNLFYKSKIRKNINKKNPIPKPRFLRKYQLELHWEDVKYKENKLAVLGNAYFSGPVLKEAAQIQADDQIIIDMTDQHLILALPDYYHSTLKWKSVTYRNDKVWLGDTTLQGKYVYSLEKLRKNDWILIDCELHKEENHPFYLVYMAKIISRKDNEKY